MIRNENYKLSYSVIVVSTPLNDRTLSGVEAGGSLMRQYIMLTTYSQRTE